jgi:glycosyltransferase involved in cell wall biosynthesis
VRLLLPSRNVGEHENFRICYRACRGRYVALLEGDDLWTSPLKLQKQYDLLERHPEWAMCIHNVNLIGDAHRPGDVFFNAARKPVYTRADFVERNFVPTCSCVLRNRGPDVLPEWFWSRELNPYLDWVLHASNAAAGDVGYVDEVLGAHRRHAGGVWGSTFDGSADGDIRRMRKRLTTFERLQECMGPEFAGALRRQRAAACFHLALAHRRKGEWPAVRRYLMKGVVIDVRAPYPFWRSYWLTWRPGRERYRDA